MSVFLPLRRATLLIPSGPQGDEERKHLFVLLTNPHEDVNGRKSVLLASLSSVRAGVPHDPSCILHAGDHPFVKRDSYVLYQKMRLEEVEKVLRGVRSGQLIPLEPMDGAVFARICKGLEESRLTSARFRDFYLAATGRT